MSWDTIIKFIVVVCGVSMLVLVTALAFLVATAVFK